jgi:hypothetical protein
MKTLTVEQFKQLLVATGVAKNIIVNGEVTFGLQDPFLPANVKIYNCNLNALHIANQQDPITSLLISQGKINNMSLGTNSSYGEVSINRCRIQNLMIDETHISNFSFISASGFASKIDGTRSNIGTMMLSQKFKDVSFFQFGVGMIHLKKFYSTNFNQMSHDEIGPKILFEGVGGNLMFQHGNGADLHQLKFTKINNVRFTNITEM